MTHDFSFNYAVNLISQEEGGYLVQFPDFPEAITQAEDEEEALREAEDCLEEAIANRMVQGLDIPPAVRCKKDKHFVSLPITLAAKCALYLTMKEKNHKNTLLAKELKCDEKEVRRLLNPRYMSKISRIEEALNLLGKKVTLSFEESEDFKIDGIPPHKFQKSDHHHYPATR